MARASIRPLPARVSYSKQLPGHLHAIFAFSLEIVRAQIKAAAGRLDGMVVWGDVAYKKGTFMSPSYWREHFKPWVAQMAECALAAWQKICTTVSHA